MKTNGLAMLVALCAAGISTGAHAGDHKTYGAYYAWNNNFNNSAIAWSPSTGAYPQWSASFNLPGGSLYGYPASIRGWHYGWNPTGDTLFPRKISTANTIPAAFSYASGGSNMVGDFAYDLFLRYDRQKSTPQLEVMIWAGNNSYPIGAPIATGVLIENGVTYDLWAGNNSAAGYYVYTFLPQRSGVPAILPSGGSANLDIKHFFNVLRGRSFYSDSMYLDVVEAGCEITRGSGWVSTTWFSVDAR
ncbi:MAG: cellulase [Rhodanobacter sp.]